MSHPHPTPEGVTMNGTAKKAIDTLGTVGIFTLLTALVALGFVLWGEPEASLIGAVFFAPLLIIGALFTVAWLATMAVVEQLAQP